MKIDSWQKHVSSCNKQKQKIKIITKIKNNLNYMIILNLISGVLKSNRCCFFLWCVCWSSPKAPYSAENHTNKDHSTNNSHKTYHRACWGPLSCKEERITMRWWVDLWMSAVCLLLTCGSFTLISIEIRVAGTAWVAIRIFGTCPSILAVSITNICNRKVAVQGSQGLVYGYRYKC